MIDSKVVRACYFGIYREKDDIGIIGWAFASEDDARKTHKALAASYAKEPERFRLWHEKKYVIWLWRDPGTTDLCFQHFEQFVTSRVEPPSNGSGQANPKKGEQADPDKPDQVPNDRAQSVRATKATQIAKAWAESLLTGQVAVTTTLSEVPFAWDRKEIIESSVDLERRFSRVAKEKGPRDVRVTKVEVLRDEKSVPKDASPADMIIVKVWIGDDGMEIAVQPGDAYRVVGFSD